MINNKRSKIQFVRMSIYILKIKYIEYILLIRLSNFRVKNNYRRINIRYYYTEKQKNSYIFYAS